MDENLQRKIDELEQNEKKKKVIFRAVVIFLIFIFIIGLGMGVKKVLLTEGTMAIPEKNAELPEPQTPGEAVGYFKELIAFALDKANTNKVKLSVSNKLSIDDDSLVTDSPEGALKAAILYIKDGVLSYLCSEYPSVSEPFGTKLNDRVISPMFTAAELQSFSCSAEEKHPENRHLVLVFNDGEFPQQPGEVLYESFDMSRSRELADALRARFASFAAVIDADIACDDFKIDALTDSVTGKLKSIDYLRRYSVKLTVAFSGDLAQLGTRSMSFVFTVKETFAFEYAGIKLSEHRMWLEKGETDNLEAFRTADGDVSVTWLSSDTSIAEVDAEGYIKGKTLSEKPVTITASFEYLGNTYTDSCEVYVRKPVDEIKLDKKELTLSPNEKYRFSVTVSPEKATVRAVCWFSSDESVAKVDENGEVTAVKEGQVSVYAISLDGNYKSTCRISVKGGKNNG